MRGGRRALGLVTSVVLLAAIAACAEPAKLEGRGYQQVFVDQFTYTSQAEMSRVWELYAPFTAPPEPQSITFHTDPGSGAQYVRLLTGAFRNWDWTYISTAGTRRADPEPNYPNAKAWLGGYFEARIRYSPNEWAWPTFWLFSQQKTENWPMVVCPPVARLVAEWDIVDSGRFTTEAWTRDHYHGALHRNTPYQGAWCGVPDEQHIYDDARLQGMDLTQWHTWGGYWARRWDGGGTMCTYVDDIEIGCHDTFDTTDQPMVMNLAILNNGHLRCDGCTPPAGTPDLYLDVDWVRVFQPG
jgi:hypothetical protein